MPLESQIIDWIRKRVRPASGVLVGIGDDAAVVEAGANSQLIACCDLMVEGVHFRSDWSPPSSVGYKALAATISDVAAMGGIPRFALISIAVRPGLPDAFVAELLDGVLDAAREYQVALVGGDTSASPDSVFLDVMVLGECRRGMSVKRSGATPGDIVLVTGALGGSQLGLALLRNGVRLDSVVSESQMEALGRHLQPEPRVRIGRAIGEAGLATAMIDISDGLSTDLIHVIEESSCGATLRADAIPIAHCASELAPALGLDPLVLALHGGEEYELLFTASPEKVDRVMEVAASLQEPVSVIGEIRAGTGLFLELDGRTEPVERGGFEHRF